MVSVLGDEEAERLVDESIRPPASCPGNDGDVVDIGLGNEVGEHLRGPAAGRVATLVGAVKAHFRDRGFAWLIGQFQASEGCLADFYAGLGARVTEPGETLLLTPPIGFKAEAWERRLVFEL